jgi:hypothetical protein
MNVRFWALIAWLVFNSSDGRASGRKEMEERVERGPTGEMKSGRVYGLIIGLRTRNTVYCLSCSLAFIVFVS